MGRRGSTSFYDGEVWNQNMDSRDHSSELSPGGEAETHSQLESSWADDALNDDGECVWPVDLRCN